MEIWNLVVGIIGALAWAPIIISFIKEKTRKINANLVDYRIIHSANVTGANGEYLKGTILVLGLNFYVALKSFFAKRMEIKIKLNSGVETNCELLDGDLMEHRDDGDYDLFVPNEMNFNLHREIKCGKDNVRIIPILAQDLNFNEIDEIEEIRFALYEGKTHKTVVVRYSDIPNFNRMHLIDKCFKNTEFKG